MRLSHICIERPVFAIVINLMLLIVGYIGFDRLSVRELPKTEQFNVEIRTDYIGASAELMENQITIPIEDVIAGVEGIEVIESKSQQGRSSILVTFAADYDIGEGMNDLRDQLSRARKSLPDDADDPILSKADPNASPSLYIQFSDTTRDALALTDYVNRYIKTELQQVEGVGNVFIFGERDYSVRIWPDPLKMASRQVTVGDIKDVLQEQNQALPSGNIKSRYRNVVIDPDTKLKHVDEFKSLVLKDTGGKMVRMSDVADVEIGPKDEDNVVRVNGQPSVVVAIVPQTTANPVDVSDEVQARLKNFSNSLPEGMTFSVSYDRATFIKSSIHEVYKTIYEAVFLVILVVFAFLGSLRSSVIPVVTIPLCLVATFGMIYLMGYTINTMTLLAIVLAIGLVVDDAIVMLENVFRHREAGMASIPAAVKGSDEIGFAIVAMTMTLAAVYAPIGFTPGFTGAIFREFAFTLAGAVVISGFVALTLSPMMCAYALPEKLESNRYTHWLEGFMHRLDERYKKAITFFLKRRILVVGFFLGVAIGGGLLFASMKSELAPMEDTGAVFVMANAPTNSSFRYLDEIMVQVQSVLMKVPERQNLVVVSGRGNAESGIAFMALKPWDERSRQQGVITRSVQPELFKIPGAQIFAIDLPPIKGGGGGNNPVDMVVQMSGTYEELAQVMDNFKNAIAKYPGLNSVQTDLKMDSQQIEIKINRDLIGNLGISFDDLNDAMNILFAGRHITDFESNGENYDVMVQLKEALRENPSQISQIYLRAKTGKMVPLSAIVTLTPVVRPNTLPHYNRMRAARLTANLSEGYTLSDAVETLHDMSLEVLPVNAKTSWAGFTKDYLESSGAMVTTVILSLIFIYLVLSAQFESFTDPFIIMLTVPFSIIGAVLFLKITGGTNNIYTQIGFVTLIGLITKHGILITDFANKLSEQGMDKFEAVVQAAVTRLRPILMTTGAMVLGAIPLALATGAGAESRSQMGWVIVGGMLFGTLFSLFVVPVAYTFISRR
ncbi:MAG: efflux RND transporter permease subunit [Gammaproteobacteria bacterium]